MLTTDYNIFIPKSTIKKVYLQFASRYRATEMAGGQSQGPVSGSLYSLSESALWGNQLLLQKVNSNTQTRSTAVVLGLAESTHPVLLTNYKKHSVVYPFLEARRKFCCLCNAVLFSDPLCFISEWMIRRVDIRCGNSIKRVRKYQPARILFHFLNVGAVTSDRNCNGLAQEPLNQMSIAAHNNFISNPKHYSRKSAFSQYSGLACPNGELTSRDTSGRCSPPRGQCAYT